MISKSVLKSMEINIKIWLWASETTKELNRIEFFFFFSNKNGYVYKETYPVVEQKSRVIRRPQISF